jgi:Na+-transporting methylmalonyl-CoA/oxaloacetate decarboxylase gamma subunit
VGNNFVLGLQVTGIGMALVFLTLIILMFAIMLLDRVFRPKREAGQEDYEAGQQRIVSAPPIIQALGGPKVSVTFSRKSRGTEG